MFKDVCQLDADGYYLGLTLAQESPLEPGKYLIPDLCVDCPPPSMREGFIPRYVDGRWEYEVFEDLPETIVEQELPFIPPTTVTLNFMGKSFTFDTERLSALSLYLQLGLPSYEIISDEGTTLITREDLRALIAQGIKAMYELEVKNGSQN